MDYVIDLQGFRDAYSRFIIKEATVLALRSEQTGHWFATPPCPFTDLPPDIRKVNRYLTLSHHGIEWQMGEVSESQIHINLRDVARNAGVIYTRGAEKALLLQFITSRQITNLEDLEEAPAFKNLPPAKTYCIYHSLHRPGEFVCSFNRALQLRSWLLARRVRGACDNEAVKSEECNEQPGDPEGPETSPPNYLRCLPC